MRNGETYHLKQKHKYYAQIQMGMAVLNLKKCVFVVYASYDSSLLIINVEYDFDFVMNMFTKIKNNYFKNMLHVLCENKSRLHP